MDGWWLVVSGSQDVTGSPRTIGSSRRDLVAGPARSLGSASLRKPTLALSGTDFPVAPRALP